MKSLVTNNKSNNGIGDKEMKNFEEIMIGSKELAQEKMVKILKTYFEHYGFKTPSFDNAVFTKDISDACSSESVEEFAALVDKKDGRALKYLDEMSKMFKFILTASEVSTANYNNQSSEETRQNVFMMCLTYLLHINHVDRATNILKMLEVGIKTNKDIVKSRTWGLANLLMNPHLL